MATFTATQLSTVSTSNAPFEAFNTSLRYTTKWWRPAMLGTPYASYVFSPQNPVIDVYGFRGKTSDGNYMYWTNTTGSPQDAKPGMVQESSISFMGTWKVVYGNL